MDDLITILLPLVYGAVKNAYQRDDIDRTER